MIKEFEAIRQWRNIRGVGMEENSPLDKRLQSQFNRIQQEVTEIHEAITLEDWDEFKDAIGDTIVTLINTAAIAGYNAEDCLKGAFDIIELRKGINKNGSFVRYAKLTDDEKAICDSKQGNNGNQYFEREMLDKLEPKDFEPKDFIN